MTLDQLLVLKSIVAQGSFRAASQFLNRAQSAVSYSIKTLEEELGFAVFNREDYRPSLTLEGQAFYKKSLELNFQYEELRELSEFLKRGHEPEIRISVSAFWPIRDLVAALKEMKKKFAQTQIRIIQDVLSNDEQLIEDKADLALGAIFNEQGLLATLELPAVRLIAVCSENHPLAEFQGKAPPSELARHPQIVMSSTLKNSNRSGGIINPTNVIKLDDYYSKKIFLQEGLGWGLMPEHLVKKELKEKSFVTLLPKANITTTHMAHHSAKELGPCGKFLWDYFSHRQKKRLK